MLELLQDCSPGEADVNPGVCVTSAQTERFLLITTRGVTSSAEVQHGLGYTRAVPQLSGQQHRSPKFALTANDT